ncbi:MAG: ribokinase [Phycisphaerae bacterium]|nr:ribokinase [Phycisphaerae bacterium]NIW43808.1 ribokinase [Gammaproteobacteria bacterium]NIX29159.1 ribokinase [Phycisphaerae bacterium]
MSDSYVLVIGAAGIDIKGQAGAPLVPSSSIAGTIRSTSGGVARNVAENLARLGEKVVFLSAIGDDASGIRVKNRLVDAKIDINHLIVARNSRTAAYLALFDKHKNPIYSIDDMRILENITPQVIYRKRNLVRNAAMIMIDSNLSEKTISSIIKQAMVKDVPVVADPTSISLAPKLKPYLQHFYMITPNANEAEILSDQAIKTRQQATRAAKKLVELGVDIAVITLAERGVVYATDDTSGHIPALTSRVVDLTGAADALTGAILFGVLNEFSIDEAVRLGASAAALTLQSEDSVLRDLTLDQLYDL